MLLKRVDAVNSTDIERSTKRCYYCYNTIEIVYEYTFAEQRRNTGKAETRPHTRKNWECFPALNIEGEGVSKKILAVRTLSFCDSDKIE